METSPQRDPELSSLLQSWDVDDERDPRLAARVWRRLETGRSSGGIRDWFEQLTAVLTRPLVATGAVAACVVVGVVAGEVRYASERADVLDRVAADYAQSIDPVIITGLHRHADHR